MIQEWKFNLEKKINVAFDVAHDIKQWEHINETKWGEKK